MKYCIFLVVMIIMAISLTSCMDMFNNKGIPIGTHNLSLFQSSDNPGFFLGKDIGDNNFQIIVDVSVLNVKGNDSLLLIKRAIDKTDTLYYSLELSKLESETPDVLSYSDYIEILECIKIKYDINVR